MGRINTGGAKKRTGDNIALASSVSGTTLKLTPPKGYYDGVVGNNVTIGDGDFVASNIRTGVNIFGVTGNVNPAELYTASATIVGGNLTINCGFRPVSCVLFYSSLQQSCWYDELTVSTQAIMNGTVVTVSRTTTSITFSGLPVSVGVSVICRK